MVAEPRERRALCRAAREPARVGRFGWPARFRQGSLSAHAGGRREIAWLRLARIHQGRGHARTTRRWSQDRTLEGIHQPTIHVPSALCNARPPCAIRRFAPNEPPRRGFLGQGGTPNGAKWLIRR